MSYVALTVVITWPIAGRLGTHIPASLGDVWSHLWTFEWVKQALADGASPYDTHLLFFPEGASLLFHNIAWLEIAVWLPLQLLVGGPTAYALIFMAVFTLNGFATYLLAREITGSFLASFVTGLVVAFWPYTLSHHDHPNLILIAWVPLALLYLKRFFAYYRVRDALFSGLFIALIGLTRWQLLVMGGLIIGLFVLYNLLVDRASRTPRKIGILLLAGLLAIAIMAPLLLPVTRGQLTRDDPDTLFVQEELAKTDLLAYLLPSRYHPLWGQAFVALYGNFGINKFFVPFIGYTVLLLAIYGTVTNWRQARFWLLAGLFYMVLALGPQLTVNGYVLPVPLPYKLVEDWFLIQIIRKPDRLNVLLSIPIAVLVGLGIVTLQRRLPSKQWAYATIAIVIGLILAEYAVRYPTLPLEFPTWYQDLAQEPGQFGILDIPMDPRSMADKTYMYYQLSHGKPIVGGHVSRPTGETFAFINEVPLLASLRPFKVTTPDPKFVNVTEQLRPLAEANVRYLILHKKFLSSEEETAWKKWLIQEPIHEDEDLVVYTTDPQLGRDFFLDRVLTNGANKEPGIGIISGSASPARGALEDTVTVSILWGSGSAIDQDYQVCINLVSLDGKVAQSSCQSPAPSWPTSNWSADEIVRGDYSFEIDRYLDHGDYTIKVSLVDEAEDALVGESELLGSFSLAAFPRVFAEPSSTIPMNITWNEAIFLPGYDLVASEPGTDSLLLTFYWQALRRMDTSYTNFVHLIDSQTQEIAAQADVIPRGWTYPTTWWEKGEWIGDTVQLSLEGVPPGSYELYTGWYDLDTGDRLPAISENGETLSNGSVLLTTIDR